MTATATLPAIDVPAVESILEQSRQMLSNMDAVEILADPMARFAVERDRRILIALVNAGKILLEQVMFAKNIHPHAMRILGQPMELEKATRIVRSAEDVQSALLVARDAVRDVKTLSPADPRIHNWMKVLDEGVKQLFEYYEERRWDGMEAEADAEIAQGKAMRFSSAANAIAFLRRTSR